ncbi:MAG: hypothetical protein J7M38_13125, partial [Armatimonadetes bacterium]|nr:hypothetical protein [Armatimonadota bacterium]
RVPLGKGSVIQVPGSLQAAPDEARDTIWQALRSAAPVTGHWPDTVLVNLMRQPRGDVLGVHVVNFDYEYNDDYSLKAIHPTPELELTVQDAALKVAWLISPDTETRDLTVTDGKVIVPPVTNYAVVLLAGSSRALNAITP